MKKYSICIANVMEKKGRNREDDITFDENVLLIKFNKYNRYIDLSNVKNIFDLSRIILELQGVVLLKHEYYYNTSPYKYVDEKNNNTVLKNTGFMGICKYVKQNKK